MEEKESKSDNKDNIFGTKEALLVIRGTSSVIDWSINMDEEPVEFIYRKGNIEKYYHQKKEFKGKDESNMDSDGDYGLVNGYVHLGMYKAALGILDEYGMRKYLLDLSAAGYDLKIVGHSLGAGM